MPKGELIPAERNKKKAERKKKNAIQESASPKMGAEIQKNRKVRRQLFFSRHNFPLTLPFCILFSSGESFGGKAQKRAADQRSGQIFSSFDVRVQGCWCSRQIQASRQGQAQQEAQDDEPPRLLALQQLLSESRIYDGCVLSPSGDPSPSPSPSPSGSCFSRSTCGFSLSDSGPWLWLLPCGRGLCPCLC